MCAALQTLHHCSTTVSDVEMNANSFSAVRTLAIEFSAVRTLAIDVVEFFIVMREYLREVEMPGASLPTLVQQCDWRTSDDFLRGSESCARRTCQG